MKRVWAMVLLCAAGAVLPACDRQPAPSDVPVPGAPDAPAGAPEGASETAEEPELPDEPS